MSPRTLAQPVALAVVLAAAAVACVEKGKGSGTRRERPGFEEAGTIFDDGDKNQNPTPKFPGMDPRTDGPVGTGSGTDTASGTGTGTDPGDPVSLTALATLASCLNMPETEIAQLVPYPYANGAAGLAAAKDLCAKFDKASFKSGNDLTAQPQAID